MPTKLATRRKAQKNTGFTTAQNGRRSDGRFQELSEKWESKSENFKERVEMAKRFCDAFTH